MPEEARKQGTIRNCLIEMSVGRAGFHAGSTSGGSTVTRCDFVVDSDLYAVLADEPDTKEGSSITINNITAKGPATRGVAISVSGRPQSVFKDSYVAKQGTGENDVNEDTDPNANRISHEMPSGSTVEGIQHEQGEDTRGSLGETANPTTGNNTQATSESGGSGTKPASGTQSDATTETDGPSSGGTL